MKKVLYGTTALLAAGMFTATAEAATPLKLTVGGYLNAFVGYTNLSEKDVVFDVNKFALGTDGEIAFNAETKLDNGIKIGAVAEVVIGTFASDRTFDDEQGWLDDVYAYIESKYGKVELGATDNVAKKLHNGAPNLSGQIVIDFISSPKNRLSGEVVAALKQAVKIDPTPTLVAGVTPLGHVEVVRRGRRQSLMESAKVLDEK